MFFSGLAAGLGQGLRETRAENARKSERDADREYSLLEALVKSDDPEIASMALAGMLDHSAQRPAKGLRGFLGEMQGHPALPTIRQLLQAGKATPNAPPEGQVPAALNPDQSAALPAGSPVEPGGPPMQQGLPGPVQFHQTPRQVFLSEAERAGRQQEAQVTAKLSAFRTGMRNAQTDEERDLVRNLSGGPRRLPNNRQLTLELDNGDGTTTMTAGYFDTQTGSYFDDNGQHLQNVKRIVPNTSAGANPNAGLRGQKIQDRTSPTGWSQVYTKADGTEAYRVKGATPYTPPPAFTGTATIEGEEGADVVRLPRGGGEPQVIGTRPTPAGAPSTDQQMAQGVVAAIDKAIADARVTGLPVQAGLRERLTLAYSRKYGRAWSYDQWVAQSKGNQTTAGVSGGPPPPPPRRGATKGKAPATKGSAQDPLGIRPGG